LIKPSISRFILQKEQDPFYVHRKQLTATGQQAKWELRVAKSETGPPSSASTAL
jgi:hypothetical protein